MCSIDGLWSGEETTCQGMLCLSFIPLRFDWIHSLSLTESVLLPFGLIAGDELVPPFDSSDPVSKLGFSNLSCPFFGVEEDTLFVSESHMKTSCAAYVWEVCRLYHSKHYLIRLTFSSNSSLK